MNFKCTECGVQLMRDVCSYHYVESGLDNVFIERCLTYSCSCGLSFPSIFRLPKLNDRLAEALILKTSLLKGSEIRFLRKRLRIPSKKFAVILSIGKTTLSKWENDIQSHSVTNDKLIRLSFMFLKGSSASKTKKMINYMSNFKIAKDNRDHVIVAEKIDNDYNVSIKQIRGTLSADESVACQYSEISIESIASPNWTYSNSSGLDLDKQSTSFGSIETETNDYAVAA